MGKPQPKPTWAPKKPTTYKAPPKPPKYEAPKKPTYEAPKKPKYNPPPPPKRKPYKPKPTPRPTYKPRPRPTNPPAPKQTYQKNAPVYVPAPKHFHKPPIIIYQGVAPPVHVYEKSSGGYSPVAQAKSGNTVSFEDQPKAIKAPALERKSDIIVAKDLSRKEAAPVAQARSTQINVASSSAVVGASVSVDEGFEILKKGTVESIDPKAD